MTVQGFGSMDEMYDAMAAAEAMANHGLTPGQVRLRDDVENTCYFARAFPEHDLVVYGVAQPNHVVERSADFDVVDNRKRGYVTGACYSVDCPTGEFGDTHVSQVIPIDLHTFTLAESFNWPTFSQLAEGDNTLLGFALARAEKASDE